ncbi:MAG: pitrilysin family protein, partial [Bacteroidota bacterium]|nr:pitrilysin family protein [Bacteroidota bacterium]
MKSISSYLVAILAFCFTSINAQAQMQIPEVPIDKDVVTGTLDNGMRYYIRKNNLPKERADFYIVHNVGAILETEEQNGLAHFCEHMAFNGTKNFPKKGVLNFLEKIGVKFGHNVNAFTGQDVTCYNLNDVPVTNELWLDSALLVLNDWSHYISFENEEIDAERGVIHEEWRTRRNARFRMQKENFGVMFNNSKYSKRDVIGEIDVIDNCSYETMKTFYHDWYRTDLQALIIVGDIDIKKMEEKVKTLFSKIPRNENAKERYNIEIPDNDEPLINIATDPEASSINIQVMYKHDIIKPEDKNQAYLMIQLLRKFSSQMLNNRFAELLQTENPPFVMGQGGYGSLARTKDIFHLFAVATPKKEQIALTTLLSEAEKVKRFGFTTSELERVKKVFLSDLETQYKDKDNRKNNSFVWKYFSNFLTNEPIPSLDFEYEFYKQIVPMLTVEQINPLAKSFVTDNNIVVTITGPEKDKKSLPTKEDVLNTLKEVKTAELEAYKEEVNNEPLMTNIPKAGKIVEENSIEKLGATELTLSNGIKVIYKKTDFKDDQILMSAYSFGGTSLYNVEDLPSAGFATSLIEQYGIGEFSTINLKKLLAGKVVSVTPQI